MYTPIYIYSSTESKKCNQHNPTKACMHSKSNHRIQRKTTQQQNWSAWVHTTAPIQDHQFTESGIWFFLCEKTAAPFRP